MSGSGALLIDADAPAAGGVVLDSDTENALPTSGSGLLVIDADSETTGFPHAIGAPFVIDGSTPAVGAPFVLDSDGSAFLGTGLRRYRRPTSRRRT